MRKHAFFAAFLLLPAMALAADRTSDGWTMTSVVYGTKAPPRDFEIGSGATPGITGEKAVYLRGEGTRARWGELQRNVSLAAWRGKRMRVSLRLRQDGEARAMMSVATSSEGPPGAGLRADRQRNEAGGAWQSHQFVLDVPADARALTINVSFVGKGAVWVDDLRLAAVDKDVARTASQRADSSNCDFAGCTRR